MPYIIQEKRDQLDPFINELYHQLVGMHADDDSNNMEGDLNYTITRLLMMIYGDRHNTRYAQINDAIGMLECCKLELYRKVAAPYEDQKEHDNGAVDAALTPLQTEEILVKEDNEKKIAHFIENADIGQPPIG